MAPGGNPSPGAAAGRPAMRGPGGAAEGFHGRFRGAFRAGLGECGPEVGAYGRCLRGALADLQQGACEAEFQRLKACMRRSMRASLQRSRGK